MGSVLTQWASAVFSAVLHGLKLDRLGHARGGDVTGRIRENLYDRTLLQQKLEHLQVRV